MTARTGSSGTSLRPWILGSASPRRRALLAGAGLNPPVGPAPIEEVARPGERPVDFAERMAREKAAAAHKAAGEAALGADTVVTIDGRILGKPRDDDDACAMIESLAGRVHEVVSAWCLVDGSGVLRAGHAVTRVRFRPLDSAEIAAYVETGEPRDKAGAYGIQGLGMRLVEGYDGDYTGVVGLPLADVLDGLVGAGLVPAWPSDIARRAAVLRGRIAAACSACGRSPGEVTLVGASKAQPLERVTAALDAGVTHLGESYAQEWQDKAQLLAGRSPTPTWHFIGRVQRNKARRIAAADLVHGVGSARAAEALGKRAVESGRVLPVLLQVNQGDEAGKSGVSPGATEALLGHVRGVSGVRVEGLMTLPPVAGLAATRARFAELRALRAALATPDCPLSVLSMGMSGDFDAAVAEHATHVRIGSALFGPRVARG